MKRFRTLRCLILRVVALVLVCGCNSDLGNLTASHAAAVSNGLVVMPQAKEFASAFPGSAHYISRYSGDFGSPTWQSQTVVGGRFLLSLSIDIELSTDRKTVVGWDDVRFNLEPIESISMDATGSFAAQSGQSTAFGQQEWEQFLNTNPLNPSELPGFDPARGPVDHIMEWFTTTRPASSFIAR